MKRSWIVPAVLGGIVTALVWSTRRREPASATDSSKVGPSGRPDPATSTPPPDERLPPATAPVPPAATPPTPAVVLEPGTILDTYRSLMAAMQADIHSVDPVLLERLTQKLLEFGHPIEASFAQQRAKCAREVYGATDLDFFPVSCAAPAGIPGMPPGPIFLPGGQVAIPQRVIFTAPPVVTQATANLLARYADAMSKILYEKNIPANLAGSAISVAMLDVLLGDLMAGGLTAETTTLRARRVQLFQQKLTHAVERLQVARDGGITREEVVADELAGAGYPEFGQTLRRAISARRFELLSRNAICSVRSGCYVLNAANPSALVLASLADQTRVTSQYTEGAYTFVKYDGSQGWVLTQALAPITA